MSINKIVKAGIGYTVGNILIKGVTFLSIPIFTKLMSPEEFGQFSIFISYASILTIFIGLCLQNTIKNAFYEFRGEIEEYINNIIFLNIILLIIYILVSLTIKDIIISFTKFNYLVIVMMLIEAFSLSIISIYNIYLTLSYQYKNYIFISSLNTLGSIALSLIFIFNNVFEKVYISRILGAVIPIFFISLYLIFFFVKKKMTKLKIKYLKFASMFAFPLMIHGLSTIILGQIDIIVLQKYSGNNATGLFAFAMIFNTVYLIIANSLNNSWGTWIFDKLDIKNYALIRKQSKKYFLFMLLVCVLLMLIIPELTMIISTNDYRDSIFMAIPLTLSSYFAYIYISIIHVEYFYKKTKYIALSSFGAAVINFLLALLLIPYFGEYIVAYIHLFSYFCYCLFHLVCIKKIANVFSLKYILLLNIIGVIFLIITLCLKNYIVTRVLIFILVMAYTINKIKDIRRELL